MYASCNRIKFKMNKIYYLQHFNLFILIYRYLLSFNLSSQITNTELLTTDTFHANGNVQQRLE